MGKEVFGVFEYPLKKELSPIVDEPSSIPN
jgi:hypothetical protein